MKAQFDESNRLIFYKKWDSFFSNIGDRLRVFFLLCLSNLIVLSICIWGSNLYSDIRYQDGVEHGFKKALDTRQPSEALEIACAGLWVGEQNKRYWQKQK